MSIITRTRKDGSIASQVILRPWGAKTIVETFDDPESAKLFEESVKKQMEASRLRRALAARGAKTREDKARKALPAAPDKQAARHTYDNELLVNTLQKYRESSEIADKAKICVATLIDKLEPVRLSELSARWVKHQIDRLRSTMTQHGKPYEYSTIEGLLSTVNCAIRWRAEDLEIPAIRLPFNKRKMIPKDYDNARTRRLDRDEELRLFGALRDVQGPSNRHWRLLIRFALETGARLQELVKATWAEFDFDRRVWTIPKKHDKTGFGRWMVLSRRAMRIARILRDMADKTNPRVFHLLGKPASISSVFARIVKRAAVEDYKFHDLRHDATSRMVLRQRQLDIDDIMQFIGHSSIAMHRRYKNLRPEEIASRVV